MAGRGRGRGATLSLTHEQLQSLGVGRGENATQSVAPPPLYPKLEGRQLPLVCDAATDYMVIVKDQFMELLHESPAYVKHKLKSDGVERYSDKYKMLALEAEQNKVLDCVWANMPVELRPQTKRPRVTANKRKLLDSSKINKKLLTLEKKETQENGENEETNEDTVKKQENDDDEDEEEVEEDQVEEIDDGTDYGNNYFEDGDGYDEEDDNLDDGPVY